MINIWTATANTGKGIAALFPNTSYCSFFDPTDTVSILSAIDDLESYVSSEGPFDGVMGFSQGAALAAMLLRRRPMVFSFAIFICAAVPLCERGLKAGILLELDPLADGVSIDVPSAHIIGTRDQALEASLMLTGICRVKKVFDHGAGHEIPVNPKGVTSRMADCVEEIITKATLVQ